jgi:hypothetical protein
LLWGVFVGFGALLLVVLPPWVSEVQPGSTRGGFLGSVALGLLK